MKKIINVLVAVMLAVCPAMVKAQNSYAPATIDFVGTVEIDLTAMGSGVLSMTEQSMTVNFESEQVCSLTLFNFQFDGMPLGDIVVDNVAVTAGTDNILMLVGSKPGLSLMGGMIQADVDCSGTYNTATGDLVICINVATMGMTIPVTFTGVPVVSQQTNYVGSISVTMFGSSTVLDNQTVTITKTGDDKCTFALYDFMFAGENIGDIVIEDVQVGSIDGAITYSGSKDNLSLANGTIKADVTCEGTETDGHLVMNISVRWMGLTIPVVFDGQRQEAGVTTAVADPVVYPVEYYRLNGTKANAESLAPGVYIIKQGKQSRKVVVK